MNANLAERITGPQLALDTVTRQTSQPLVSIITPTRDRPDMVVRLLASIRRQTYPSIETLIVDDGSIPPLSQQDQARIFRNETSQGFCLANNRAFAQARGEFLLLINDDAELADEHTVQRAVDLALQHPEAGAIAFGQLQPGRQPCPLQPAATDRLSYVARFLGYGCLLRKGLIDRIGGFNPVFGAYHEDIEMSLRILQSGKSILYDPQLQVVHHEDTRHRRFWRIHRQTFRNALLTALLRYPWYCVPVASASYLVNFVRMTRGGDGFDPLGVLLVAGQILWHWRHVWHERRPLTFSAFCEMRGLRMQPIPVAST